MNPNAPTFPVPTVPANNIPTNNIRGGRGANNQGGPSYRPNQNRAQSEQCIVCFVSGNMNCPHCFHCGGSDHDRNNCHLN